MRILLCAVVAMMAMSVPALAEITVTTEEYPPYNMTQNGQVVGLSTDLVRAIFEKANVPYKIEVLPWQRAYNDALNNKDTCVYSTTETPERKELFEWVGPLAHNNWVLFASADGAKPLAALEDARDRVIGAYQGDAIALFLEKEGYKVELAPRDELNPAKLVNGRLALWATGSELGPYLAHQQGIDARIVPVLTFKETVMSLACNKRTAPETVAALRAALAAVLAAKK